MKNLTTKKAVTIFLFTTFLLVAGFIALGTTQVGLTEVREDGGEDSDTLEHVFNRKLYSPFVFKPDDTWELPDTDSESAANGVEFNLTTDGNNKTFSAVLYAWKAINGPAKMVCTITAIGGSQQVRVWPDETACVGGRNWVDTVVITKRWPKLVTAGGSGDGDDIMTTIWCDAMGHKFWKWFIWDADGSGAEASSVSVWGSYF